MSSIAHSAISNLKQAGLGDVLYVRGEQAYKARQESYWSLTPRLGPWAIVQPRNTEEVSKAVKALIGTLGCNFAIRSGGHMSWVGAGNDIESGVTIDFGLMTRISYDSEAGLASLQPGGRWVDVYTELEKHGVMVAGGREGLVGIGGFLIGGGLNFHTCRYGFSCDQIANYEVVLADGSIVEANSTTNSDLFRVLKGGQNNFGIITRFDMHVFEAKNIWDGVNTHPKTASSQVIEAYIDYSADLAKNPDSHILAMWTHLPGAKEHVINLVLTNLDGVENAKSFERFLAIPGSHNMRTTTVATKLRDFLVPSGRYAFWLTLTFKLDRQVIYRAIAAYEAMLEKLRETFPEDDFGVNMVLQPLMASWTQHSVARGGNMLGLENLADDCVVLVVGNEAETAELSEKVCAPALRAMFAEIESYATSLGKNVDFLYLNYCDGSQEPLRTYGEENIKRMKEMSAKYDPTGVFQERVPGGYKISKIQ